MHARIRRRRSAKLKPALAMIGKPAPAAAAALTAAPAPTMDTAAIARTVGHAAITGAVYVTVAAMISRSKTWERRSMRGWD